MDFAQLKQAYVESQKELFKLRAENDELRCGQRWHDVSGSSWELAQAAAHADTLSAEAALPEGEHHLNALDRLTSTLRNYEATERFVAAGFRQIKYELYCATVDLLGYSLHVTPERNCLVTSTYALHGGGAAEFEFIYDPHEHRYVDLLWSDAVAKYAQMYRYWIEEQRCIQGFLASVFLEEYGSRGPPSARSVRNRNN